MFFMKESSIKLGLTFDDILLVPKKSPVASRQDVDTSSNFSRHVKLSIPIVSANMDTVTESTMAIAVAREGGLGIIHRFMTVEQQVAEVMRVKRWEHVIINDPYTLPPLATLGDMIGAQEKFGVTSFLVVDEDTTLVGIITARDIVFEKNESTRVNQLMTPRERLITAAADINQVDAKHLLHQHRIEKLPLVDAGGKLVGLITLSDILKREKFPATAKDTNGRLLVGGAIGVKDDFLERAAELIKAGTDVLVLDIAHGHSDIALSAIKAIRQKFSSVELVAGNVATATGTAELIAAGVDAIKVGVGPGSMCTTRVVTGSGVPQFTAIADCATEAKKHNIPIIADGGIRASGDIVKALAAGASAVMIGNLFAGTDESPGQLITRGGQKVKVYQGMASRGAAKSRSWRQREQLDDTSFNEMVPEGVEAVVPYRGPVRDTLHQLVGGLRSGLSYGGATNISGLQKNAEFIQITAAGWKEGLPHDAEITS